MTLRSRGEHLVDDAQRVLLEEDVPGELLEARLPRGSGLLELHEDGAVPVSRASGQVDDHVRRRVAA